MEICAVVAVAQLKAIIAAIFAVIGHPMAAATILVLAERFCANWHVTKRIGLLVNGLTNDTRNGMHWIHSGIYGHFRFITKYIR